VFAFYSSRRHNAEDVAKGLAAETEDARGIDTNEYEYPQSIVPLEGLRAVIKAYRLRTKRQMLMTTMNTMYIKLFTLLVDVFEETQPI